jgi:DNA-binding PadR family transcriptional regulator
LWADGEDERPCTTSEIAECFYELNWYDLQEGNRVHYAPPSTGSMYATLKGLERRGLVSQDDVRDHRGSWKSYVWTLTPAGREAARLYCR